MFLETHDTEDGMKALCLAVETAYTRNVGHTRRWLRAFMTDSEVSLLLNAVSQMDALPKTVPETEVGLAMLVTKVIYPGTHSRATPMSFKADRPAFVDYPVISVYPKHGKAKIIRLTGPETHELVTEYRPWDVFRSLLDTNFEDTVANMGGLLDMPLSTEVG